MITFLHLSHISKAFVLSFFFAALTGLLFLLILRRMRKCRPCACLAPASLLLLVGFTLLFLLEAQKAWELSRLPSPVGYWVGSLPWAIHALLLVIADIVCALGLWREWQIAQKKITPDSIREALDNLPSGLCFSKPSGMPLLTNRKMYELTENLSGHRLRNAEELWQELSEFCAQNGIECVQSGRLPTFRFSSGGVRQFSRAELMIEGEPYIQTTSADITRLYILSQELAESNAALHAQHKRLKGLLSQIVQIKREEEILTSKVKLHDELGRCVLVGRRFLLQTSADESLEPVLALWRETVETLEVSLEDTDKVSGDTLRQLTDAAATLGCAIEFVGAIPENGDIAYLLLSAVREAVTNAVRHANADRVTVRISEEDGVLTAQITDNGTKRPKAIIEGGGLRNLRRRVERAGGLMEVTCEGGVRLHLKLLLTAKVVKAEGFDMAH